MLKIKVWWWYSYQTWTVSSSKGCSPVTDITCSWGWGGVIMLDSEILPYFDFVAAKGITVLQTRLVFIRSSSDGTYYGMVMSIRPSGSPSFRLSVTVFRTFLLHALTYWAEILHLWLCFIVLQIKFKCRQFESIFVGVKPLLELRILEIHSFLHFSPTCFDILSWNFFIWLCFTVLQIKLKCRQFVSN